MNERAHITRVCDACREKGYAPDDAWPQTREFWPLRHGRLHFGMCRACREEQRKAQSYYRRKRKPTGMAA